jgi:hypothetical protein
MSKEIGLLSKVLGEDVETLTTKLADENGYKEIETKLDGFKVFKSNDEYLSTLNNYKNSIKDSLYAEHKGSIHESFEKNLLQKHNLDYKRGEHFKTTDELVEKIIEEKAKAGKAAGEGNDKELEKATLKIQELSKQLTDKETELHSTYGQKIKDLYVGSVLSGIKPLLDEPTEMLDGKLEFIKYQFEKEFSIREKDGKYVVYKGDEVYRDATSYKEMPLESVLQEIASKVSKLKTSPAAGRGANNSGNNNPTNDYSQFKTWEEVLAKTELGKLRTGDVQLNKAYGEWKKSQG